MSPLSLWRKAAVYRALEEFAVAKAAFCFDYGFMYAALSAIIIFH